MKPRKSNVTFSDDAALEYIMALENPHKVGWDSKNRVWRTPKEKGYDKNQIAYGLDIRQDHNPVVYNFLKEKGRLKDPWLTEGEATDLMALLYAAKNSSVNKAVEKMGGNISQRGYNVLRGMAWHGHPMKQLLNPDSITGKAFLRAIANGDQDLNSVFDAYYGYGSNATQFADRIKADAKQRGSIIMETLGDGNKRMRFLPVPQWKPQPLPLPIPETQYPLNGSQAPESISSWNGADSPSAVPTIPSIQKLNNKRNADIQGAFSLPLVTVTGNRKTSLLPKMPSLNDALMAYSPLNQMNRAMSEMMGLDDLWEDFDVTSDLFKAKNGKLPKYKDGKDDDFEIFRQTLPDNQKNTPEYMYRTKRYWELNGKPKNFGEAIGRGMYTYEGDGWHANSVAYNESTGEYEFMKPNYHNTKMMEDAWYYSKDGEEFRNLYTKTTDPTGVYDKYIPKKKKGLIGLKNGKLPRYNTGLVPELTEERSDNTRVVRPEIHLPVKRQLLKKLVTTELMLLATENKPVVKLDNYTRKRVAEESNKRTWRSDVADQLHNLGEASLLASNFVPFEGQMLEGANWMAQTAKSYLTHPFYKTVYHGSPYPFNIKNAWTATANDLGLHVGSKQTAATMADKSGVVYKLRIPKENTLTIDMGSNGAQQLSDSFFMPAQSKQFPNSYYDTTLGDDFRILMLKDAGAEPSVVGNRLYTENTVMLPIRSKVYPNISEKYMRDIHELRRQTLMNTDGITRRPIDMNLQMRLNQQANDILRDSGYKVIKYHNANPYEGGGTAYMITDPSVMDVLPNMPKLKPLMWPIGTDAAYISTK